MTYTYNNKSIELNTQSEFSVFCDQIKMLMDEAYENNNRENGDMYAKVLVDVQQLAINNLDESDRMIFIAQSL